ncbi:MAG: SDR family oxidoreductase [Proteobacteria bacterium]|nr:SDR family oxidoreductase [Pseudomonadota bacterium]
MKILIFGGSGMLGSTLINYLSAEKDLQVWGTFRSLKAESFFNIHPDKLIHCVHVENKESLMFAFKQTTPDVVINCIGVVKQLTQAKDPLQAIAINAQFPHVLSGLCKIHQARLIHVSTDCVFSGNKGNYVEEDVPDARDLYGRSKLLGEIEDFHVLTIRTSMIGHELNRAHSLIEWFLSQKSEIRGFKRALFSGFATIELARIIKNIIINFPDLAGLYHVGADPIDKYTLLKMVAEVYQKKIRIVEDSEFVIDRSLNGSKFNQITGYKPPLWPAMILQMYEFQKSQHKEIVSI